MLVAYFKYLAKFIGLGRDKHSSLFCRSFAVFIMFISDGTEDILQLGIAWLRSRMPQQLGEGRVRYPAQNGRPPGACTVKLFTAVL